MAKKRRKKESTKQEPVKEWPKEQVDLTKQFRPQEIDDLFGNSVLKKTIKAAMKQNNVPHAVLLQGPFGSGKTTIARILAQYLECSTFDFKEIDIADFSGVDLVREIRRKMGTRPMKGKTKVWILDEVHKLSNAGQNALLKALEEPPEHCYFFLCTTDPQNIINTVKSRCVQYTVQTLSEKQIFDLLQHVSSEADIELPKKVGLQIARDSLGHPRNALKILEKVMYLEQDEMLDAAKEEAEKREQAIALCRAMMDGKSWKQLSAILKNIKDEPETVRRTIRGYFTSVLLGGTEPAFIVLDCFKQPFYNTDAKNELVRCVYEAHQELHG